MKKLVLSLFFMTGSLLYAQNRQSTTNIGRAQNTLPATITGKIEITDAVYNDMIALFGNRTLGTGIVVEVWKVAYQNAPNPTGGKQPVNISLQNKVANVVVQYTKIPNAIAFNLSGVEMDGNYALLTYLADKPKKYIGGDIRGLGNDGSGRDLSAIFYRANTKTKIGMDKIWGLYSLRPTTDNNNIIFSIKLDDGKPTTVQASFLDDIGDWVEGAINDIGKAVEGMAGVFINAAGAIVIQIGEITYNVIAYGNLPKHRTMSEEEYRWANDKIYNGTLPSRSSIIITNLMSVDKRQYTIPTGTGLIFMNMGDGYDNPMTFTRKNEVAGQVFIHECGHAYQIEHHMGTKAASEGLSNIAKGQSAYVYACGQNWDNYNFEQQAHIIDACFYNRETGSLSSCEQEYVEKNVRGKAFPQTQTDWRYCSKCQSLFFNGYPQKGICSAGGQHSAAGYNFVLPHDAQGNDKAQTDWRFCGKCYDMFFDGYPTNKGICTAGERHETFGEHEAIGYSFVLPHDVQGTSTAQASWRFCSKCNMMFFDGYPNNKGICANGGGHTATGYNFVLPHDVSETSKAQASWRFCTKCNTVFFDGYPSNKGKCASGGGHTAAGYNFVLPHDVQASNNAQASWRFCGKCSTMFFDGYPQKGACPGAAKKIKIDGHVAAGYNFILPHDIPASTNSQTTWRFCNKCNTMFFDGYPQKGVCSVGGAHTAVGYNFVLGFKQ